MGAGKTGTTSIASSFHAGYRAQHEPEARETARLVIDYLSGAVSREDVKSYLKARDGRLHLEIESASPLGYLSGILADLFDDAKFVVTIREPHSWLRSRLNYHFATLPTEAHAPEWVEWRDYFWARNHQGYKPEERSLEAYGLYSIDVYLDFYADHYRRVLSELPAERMIMVRTSELNERYADIADFVGADYSKLVMRHGRKNRNDVDCMEGLDDDFVRERIMHHCSDLVEQFFPERLRHYADVRPNR